MQLARGEAAYGTANRVAKTPGDRLRVAKQQFRTTNSAHTKLHAMFEETIQELESTKAKLEATQRELEATQRKLEDTKEMLRCSNEDVEEITELLISSNEEVDIFKGENSCLILARNYHEQHLAQLDDELEQEKKKVKKSQDAEEKLEQLRKHWSTFSAMLSD
ncbi:uncharacterized protein K460DRAFT_402165 [Cucurbitaria berberidis CBS 394.84]|uniref:Uncharacterized protein n=1 Tax=Cucurbitaria berberidis CBS 394.84 TaxID=1168544 RepID=A0A9P4GW96_9PLEO|nr:uncharacterized protein K460DRAFT_402165 [Cucurbitaria berberidis CBS 394.84]KAF1852176.1 hypothetical protein K460DRAFT_402165 [Cucurbitaria berberidis CBS 394.84]